VKGLRVVLRKPKTTVTNQNHRILQLLDLLGDIEVYADAINEELCRHLARYIQAESMKRSELEQCLTLYPASVNRTLNEMRLLEAFVYA